MLNFNLKKHKRAIKNKHKIKMPIETYTPQGIGNLKDGDVFTIVGMELGVNGNLLIDGVNPDNSLEEKSTGKLVNFKVISKTST